MGRKPKSIDLRREFVPITDDSATVAAGPWLAAFARHRGNDLGWKQVLLHPYVVVLGEAGTGKSTEFRRQVATLRSQGNHAFFLELSSLARSMVHALDDESALESWRASDDAAYFFLDALDEAKLSRSTLEEALRCLKHALCDDWSRARLVVSCRVSDWAISDRKALLGIVPEQEPKAKSPLHIVQFVGLEQTRVKQLARSHGVTDVDAFWDAIEEQDMGPLVERPLDVEVMSKFWNAQSPNRLGTLREVNDHHIETNLRESQPKRRPRVAPARIREGALALAGLATISGRVSFLLPDEEPDETCIDPALVLPDWSQEDRFELMSRGLFDPSTYGRVRFHHRDIQDYLASQWLNQLAENGVPQSKLEDILIRSTPNGEAVPRHLQNTVAWMCLDNVALCERVSELSPSTLLSHGDATGLTDAQRVAILKRYTAQYGDRIRRSEHFPKTNLRRFATASLAGTIREMVASDEVPTEMKEHLLRMVQSARLSGNRDQALSIALNDAAPMSLRGAAIRALKPTGTPGDHMRLSGLLHTPTRWNHDFAAAFVRCLYPGTLGVSGLLQLLNRLKPSERSSSFEFALRDALVKGSDSQFRHDLLRAMLRFFAAPSLENRRPAPRHSWLVPSFGALIEQVLRDSADGSARVVEAVELLAHWVHNFPDVHVYDFPKALEAFPKFRRRWLWTRVERYAEDHGRTPSFYDLRTTYEPWADLSALDIDWLKDDVADSKRSTQERLLAFNALATLVEPNELRALAADTDFLERRCDRMMNPPAMIHRKGPTADRSRETQANMLMWTRRDRASESRAHRKHEADRRILLNQLDQLRGGSALGNLYVLADCLERESASLAPIVKLYGQEVAEAAELGWQAFWRTHWCPLPHEGPGRFVVLTRVKIGLAGIAAERRASPNLSHFSDSDVEHATRYATHALNKFPVWLDELASLNPGAVLRILGPCIRHDFNARHPLHSGVLSKIGRSGPNIRRTCTPLMLALLGGQRGARRRVGLQRVQLQRVRRSRARQPLFFPKYAAPLPKPIPWAVNTGLDFIVRAKAQHLLAPVAALRCRMAADEPERFALWWCVWLEVQALQAVEALEEILARRSAAVARILAETCCARLHHYSASHGLNTKPTIEDLPMLERLVPLVYEYIPIETDQVHPDVYTPDRRDDAEIGRRTLRDALVGFEGEAATAALRRVANHPALATSRDYFLGVADERVITDAALRDSPIVEEIFSIYRAHGASAMNSIGEKMTDRIDVVIITMKSEESEAVLDRMDETHVRNGKNRKYRVSEMSTTEGTCHVALTRAVTQVLTSTADDGWGSLFAHAG